ncbi:9515_t:CDS:1 [Racocetra fulgida]|uniref:9515_t:CDS:1 n=1 Tax=Racocetra fulgida TaxID=60492 RepID=A0A9N8WCX2_9GLOM|nr:9515_t:CDS:1 [Racocetra fulgida]
MTRKDLINSYKIPDLFFVYEAVDAFNYKNYLLHLFSVCTNGEKITINIIIKDIFFDIKLKSEELIDSYIDEFKPDSFEIIEKQPFDSKKYNFIRLYFKTYKERKEALQSLKDKLDKLNELKEHSYLKEKEKEIIQQIED